MLRKTSKFFVLLIIISTSSIFLNTLTAVDGEQNPILNFQLKSSTFLGGYGKDYVRSLATDSEGNIILTGETASSDLPVTQDAFQSSKSGSSDAFLAKLNPDGTEILFLTYFGGSSLDLGNGLGIDSNDDIWVCGATSSSNFPVSENATQPTIGGYDLNGFIAKFSSNGKNLLYSSYFGGTGFDWCYGGVVDANDNFICTGHFSSPNLATGDVFQTVIGSSNEENGDAMVIKSNPNGTIEFATYFGGNDWDWGINVDVDSNNNILIGGHTKSTNLPTTSNVTTSLQGTHDSFVFVLNSNGSELMFSRYLGGESTEACTGVKFDSEDNLILSGYTTSTDFPIQNALYSTHHGGRDIFVAKINKDSYTLNFSTFIGGLGTDGKAGDHGNSLVLGNNDVIYVIGNTNSEDFPTINPGQAELIENSIDTCLISLSNDGQELQYSTYYGGAETDYGNAIGISHLGYPIISGVSTSREIYNVNSLYGKNQGGEDIYLAVMEEGDSTFESQSSRTISRPFYLDLSISFLALISILKVKSKKKGIRFQN